MTFLELGKEHPAHINGILNSFKGTTDTELEFRFKDVSRIFFYRAFGILGQLKVENKTLDTIEYITKDIRHIQVVNENECSIVQKKRIHHYDIQDFKLRLSMSSEILIKQNAPIPKTFDLVREKYRNTFVFEPFKIELTRVIERNVKGGGNDSVNKFEIEIEFNQIADYRCVVDILYYVLKIRHDNLYITPESVQQTVLREYHSQVKQSRFASAKPVNLHGRDLKSLYTDDYAVTKKIDGTGVQLYINSSQMIYIVGSDSVSIGCTGLSSSVYKYTLFDAEKVTRGDKTHFYICDIMIYNGVDLRGDQEYTLQKRLEIIEKVLDTIESSEYYSVSLKEYYFYNVFLGSKILYNENKDEKLDGLIFVKIDDAYPRGKWPTLYKWKPEELNTIDFVVEFNGIDSEGKQEWTLLTKIIKKEPKDSYKKQTTINVPFDVRKLTGERIPIETFKTFVPVDAIDSTTGLKYMNGTVIEFRFCKEARQFVPLRTRWDKTDVSHGNFVDVALDIYDNIINPIPFDTLTGLTKYSTLKPFTGLTKAQNYMKKKILDKYCTGKSVLDLCCGKGKDYYASTSRVYGYDFNFKYIQETLDSDRGGLDKFFCMDLTQRSACSKILVHSENKQFDVVMCNFGIQYFMDSENSFNNFLQIVNSCLLNNGKLTLIFPERNSTVFKVKNREVMYYIEHDSKQTLFGNKCQVYLNGSGSTITENIVNRDLLVAYLGERGYTLHNEEFPPENHKDVKDSLNQDLLNLTKSLVFIKNESKCKGSVVI